MRTRAVASTLTALALSSCASPAPPARVLDVRSLAPRSQRPEVPASDSPLRVSVLPDYEPRWQAGPGRWLAGAVRAQRAEGRSRATGALLPDVAIAATPLGPPEGGDTRWVFASADGTVALARGACSLRGRPGRGGLYSRAGDG